MVLGTQPDVRPEGEGSVLRRGQARGSKASGVGGLHAPSAQRGGEYQGCEFSSFLKVQLT